MNLFRISLQILFPLFLSLSVIGCKKGKDNEPVIPITPDSLAALRDTGYADDYSQIANNVYSYKWGPYNLHDPSIIKSGKYYYIFSTDVAYGDNARCGIMFRKSPDLAHWFYLGWVFNGIPPKPLAFMQAHQPGYQQLGIWAPYIIKVGDTYRLYYSVPGNSGLKLACIALATSNNPLGPWNDEGIVISCLPDDPFNAIDPSVVIDQENGRQWMTYGSYSDGIYIVEPEYSYRTAAF